VAQDRYSSIKAVSFRLPKDHFLYLSSLLPVSKKHNNEHPVFS